MKIPSKFNFFLGLTLISILNTNDLSANTIQMREEANNAQHHPIIGVGMENNEARVFLKGVFNGGIKQNSMAAELNVNASTLSRFINGRIKNSSIIVEALNKKLLTNPILWGRQSETIVTPLPNSSPISQNQNLVIQPMILQAEQPTLSAQQQIASHPSPNIVTEVAIQKLRRRSFAPQRLTQVPIDIPYRNDGEGKGAFYDHYTLQRSTGHSTRIAVAPQQNHSNLAYYIAGQTFNLPYGILDQNIGKILPQVLDRNNDELGLLIIPGRPNGIEDPLRVQYERVLIKEAQLKGRPILAICGGSWRLWEAFHGTTKSVTDHNYNAGMVRLSNYGYITYNVQIHSIEIQGESLLARAMRYPISSQSLTTVNSVHWLGVNDAAGPHFSGQVDSRATEEALYNSLVMSARAKRNPLISLQDRHQRIMTPEEDTVEAFESRHGAPLFGIQWHPEAYFDYLVDRHHCTDQHQVSLLQYMAKAGDAYAAKQRLLREFKSLIRTNE